MTTWRHIIVETRGKVGRIVLNRPDARNPLDRTTSEEILAAMKQHFADPEVLMLEITGAGGVFCAGGDLSQINKFADMSSDEAAEWAQPIIGAHELMLSARKPVIAAVDGPALAGGLGLAGMCDIILATRASTFGTPEVKIGLFPMIIVAHLSRSLPRKRLMEMMITGESIGADEARDLGFVSKVVDTRAELDELVQSYARKFERVSPTAVMMGRRAFTILSEMPAGLALRASQFFNLWFSLSEDLQEGTNAFLEKRKPNWKEL